jgi:TIR domain
MTSSKARVLVSYSSQDRKWRDRLSQVLSRFGDLKGCWSDAGHEVVGLGQDRMDEQIERAQAMVLVVSRHFLRSEEAAATLRRIESARERRGLAVTWVLVDECDTSIDLLEDCQAAHDLRKPLASLSEGMLSATLERIGRRVRALTVHSLEQRRNTVAWDLDSTELGDLVREAVESMDSAHALPSADIGIPEAEKNALVRAGFDLKSRRRGGEDPLATTAAEYAALLQTSLTTQQAAERLGVQPSRIRQRLNSKPASLLGIHTASRGWRLPEFQFTSNGALPGIELVIRALDPRLHAVSVYRWFHTPNPDLITEAGAGGGSPLSPIDWLRSGCDPSLPVELAAKL